MRGTLGVATAVVLLALAGCDGGDGGSGPDDDTTMAAPTAATVRPALVALWTGNDAAAGDAETGECFADALLERVEPADLVDAGVLDVGGAAAPEQPHLDAATAEAWVDAQFQCSDFVAESTRALTAQSKGKLDGRRYARCLRGALTEEQLREAVAESLQGRFDAPAVTRLSRAQRTCATQALPPD